MWFEIPDEHAETPEAIRLLELDAEFSEVCAQDRVASKSKLYESDPDANKVLEERSRELRQALQEAVEAYDEATGEPNWSIYRWS